MNKRICLIDGCEGRVHARAWCRKHYKRWYKYGDPLAEVNVPVKLGGQCEVDACERDSLARSLCKMHYQRWRKTGDPGDAVPRSGRRHRFCTMADCTREHFANGYCTTHHRRWKKHGDATVGHAKPRYQPIVRSDGYRWVWLPDHPGAHMGRVPEHRAVMEQVLGRELLAGENVHHRNGDRCDNRPENLELWVVHQPKGQRPEDLVAWAQEILLRYG